MQTTGNQVSLYFHIPFCSKKCPYCHFYVIPNRSLHKEIYLKALLKEWRLRFPLLRGKEIVSIYFGGGTPSLFPEAVEEVMNWISQEGLFLSQDLECSFEVNPEDVSLELIKRVKSSGVNRISMGVQSLSDASLSIIGREHGSKKALEALDSIQKAGIANVSIDLMYDLPGQTAASFEETLRRVETLPITHLSLYNLTLEPHTAFFKKREEISARMPKAEESLEMLEQAVRLLESFGLKRYEISAFAKDGLISRHNTGYWLGRPFLGFGPSAFSYWENRRFKNTANLLRYAKLLDEGKDPADFSEELPLEDRQKEMLCVQMRLIQGVDLLAFQQKYGELSAEIKKSLQELSLEGLIVLEGSKLSLSEKGLLFHDTVAEAII
jgi:oxygen-independent coproporphyrinogen III oxidase